MSEVVQPPAQATPEPGDKLYDAKPEAQQPEQKAAGNAEVKTEQKSDAAPEKKDEAPKPGEYSLKLPEETAIKPSDIEMIKSYAKEKNLSNEDAQKLVDLQHEAHKKQAEAQMDEFKKTVDSWKQSASQDSEYGGTNFNKNVELAKRVVEKFATDDFMQALDDTGFGNHPELLRVFYRIGQAMGEGRLVLPGQSSGNKKSLEEVFYGNNN